VKPKPAQENWYRVAICLHKFGQRLVAPRLQILEIFRVIGAEPHHHGKVADLGQRHVMCQSFVGLYPLTLKFFLTPLLQGGPKNGTKLMTP